MTINLKEFIDEKIRADVETLADKCPIRHILPKLDFNGGTVTQVLVAENGLELPVLAAFCIEPKISRLKMIETISELRDSGQVKMIHPFEIKPEMKHLGYSWSEIDPQAAIECIYTPELYFIRFLGFRWS